MTTIMKLMVLTVRFFIWLFIAIFIYLFTGLGYGMIIDGNVDTGFCDNVVIAVLCVILAHNDVTANKTKYYL